MELRVEARAPFKLQSVVASHGWVALAPFTRTETGFDYVLQLTNGRALAISVYAVDRHAGISTEAELDETETSEVVDRVEWMLGAGQNLQDFYALCRPEPKLATVEREAKGRMLRSATLFEDVVKTMLTTNTSWAGTKRMTSALVDLYGVEAENVGGLRSFPTAKALASASEEELRAKAGLGYRAPYVLEFAQRVDAGELDLQEFVVAAETGSGSPNVASSRLSTEDLRKRLLAIKGIGPYAAANLLMLLGRYDYLPVDSWARTLVSREWYDEQPVGEPEVQQAFANWGEWKALVYSFWEWER